MKKTTPPFGRLWFLCLFSLVFLVIAGISTQASSTAAPPTSINLLESVSAAGPTPIPTPVPTPVSINVAESVSVADSVQVLPPVSINVAESVSVADSVQVLPPVSINVAESVSVADSVQVLPPVSINVVESVRVADSVQVLPPVSINVAESVSVADSVQVLLAVSINVAESVSVADSVQVLPPATPTASTTVTGITREVNGNILPGVSITLDGTGPVVSDQNGHYEIMATATGNYTVLAHKGGFRDRTQTVSIAGLGQGYAVTCNFQGQHGLIPKAPDIWYALDCVNLWLYPPNPDTGLDIWTALDVINAWLYPVH